jgi:hypothetical protein
MECPGEELQVASVLLSSFLFHRIALAVHDDLQNSITNADEKQHANDAAAIFPMILLPILREVVEFM